MSALGDYYEAQAAEKKASIQQVQAQAGLVTAQTQELSGNDAATRGLQNAQAGAATAQAGKTNADARNVDADDASTRNAQSASAGVQGAQAGLIGQQASNFGLDAASTRGLQGAQIGAQNTASAQGQQNLRDQQGLGALYDQIQGHEKGGKVVPEAQVIRGKAPKPGPTDTVPAMLTPGEAVLNKGAAEHYGSDVIDHMNKMGLMRMSAQSEVAKHAGLPDPHALPKVQTKAERAAKKAPPVGPGGSKQPAGGAPQATPGGGAMPGFAKGTGMVLPSYYPADKAAIGDLQPQLDPTSYGLGVLHGAAIGTTNPKDSSQKSA